MFKAKVFVSLKQDVMDPQGETIRAALTTHGFEGVSRVDTGRYYSLIFDLADKAEVEKQVQSIAHDVLSNPVIEDFSFTIEPYKED